MNLKSVIKKLEQRYTQQADPWGLNPTTLHKSFKALYPIYKSYFKVRVFGLENVNVKKNYLMAANHTGQIAIDGALISMAFVTQLKDPILPRPLIDRLVPALPWLGSWLAGLGAVVGDRTNCIKLLENKESVLVFPEGIKGIAKNTSQFYKLQRFTTGFIKMAHAAKTDILPIAVVGAEEMFPFVYHPKPLARLLKLPALPIMPFYFPLPSPIDIHIGKPISLKPSQKTFLSMQKIHEKTRMVQKCIQDLVTQGLKKRRPFWITKDNDL